MLVRDCKPLGRYPPTKRKSIVCFVRVISHETMALRNANYHNPFLVILGPSPGNSPAKGDVDFITVHRMKCRLGYAHPKFFYPCTIDKAGS